MIKGSCLCKRVTYTVTALEGASWDCFCQTCRKAHAADHNTAQKVLRPHFVLSAEAGALKAYESSPGKLRHFCQHCGTHIYAERPELPFVVLRAATLDDDPGARPAAQVWLSHRKPWTYAPDGVPAYPEAPPA